MSRPKHVVSGAFALAFLAASVAAAQAPVAPGSDRAGKARGSDTPPPEPTPAAGSRLSAQPDTPVAVPSTGRAAMRTPAAPPVIGSQQIDRYDAINKVRTAVKENPKSLTDWVILGELAHEVAMDAPADDAAKYFGMSSDAFEKALALDPNNAGLKAAVQFTRDQKAHVDEFEKSRDAVTDTFLDARRRDLAATGNTPYVRVYSPPLPDRTLPGPDPSPGPGVGPVDEGAAVNGNPATGRLAAAPPQTPTGPVTGPGSGTPSATLPAPAANTNPARSRPLGASASNPAGDASKAAVAGAGNPTAESATAVFPARERAPSTDSANYGTQQDFSAGSGTSARTFNVGPTYQPFANANGAPYTYQQYSNSYFPQGMYNNPSAPPVTIQRYGVPAAGVAPNSLERQILNRARTATPAPAPR